MCWRDVLRFLPPTKQAEGRRNEHWRYRLSCQGFGHFEIHLLLWRLETFGLTHQLIISNLVEVAQ
jgi:hypothetical protein